ncbi:MAG TPA: hypothetical protein VH575_23490 [Gemmataceae bacterium]|jgi:hypothetical protein
MSSIQLRRIGVGGTVMALALSAPDQVFVLVRTDQGAGRLLCLDLEGRPRGELILPGPPGYPFAIPCRKMRVAEDGSAWLGEGRTLARIGADGQRQTAVEVPVETSEEMGSFLLLPDGFAAAFHRPVHGKAVEARGRVARLDAVGGIVWSTILAAETVAYAGVVEMGVDSGWQLRPKKPWRPEDWQPARRGEPLLLSDDRLLVRYFELRSGLGRTFCLDWVGGRILWATEPRPEASVARLGPGGFLLGVQGYGAFDLDYYGWDGVVRQHWPRHAEVVVTEQGEVRGVEMENISPSRMHFSVFEPDGTIRQGPHLEGYYTTYPVLSREGVAAFWRDGKLRTVDASLEERTLWQDEGLAEKKIMTRMLLADDGTLLFGLEDELFLVPTDLGPMANNPWPCGSGNARGNPVFQAR